MKTIITALFFYLGQASMPSENDVTKQTTLEPPTTIKITSSAQPQVIYVNKKELIKIAYEGNVPAGFDYKSNSTLALYNHKNNTIYLHESVDLETIFGKSILLHELVHFNQYAMGEYETAECIESNEKLAYEVQNQYLIDHGLTALYNKRHIFFASLCPDFI